MDALGIGKAVVAGFDWGTVDKVVRKIHDLGQEGVQFATFPETVVSIRRLEIRQPGGRRFPAGLDVALAHGSRRRPGEE